MAKEPKKVSIQNRLLTRLLISHILMVALPLFISGRVLVDNAQDSIKETILKRNREFAERSTRFVELKINTASELLKTLAQFQTIFEVNRRSQELAINTLVSEFAVFNELSILDTTGQIVASSSFEDRLANGAGSKAFAGALLQTFSDEQSYRSDVYVSEERLPMMDLAEPIRVYTEIAGILYAVVDLKAMWDLVDENMIGNQGEAFIFDTEGTFIAHSDRKNVYSEKRFENSEVMVEIHGGQSGQMIYTTPEGVEMVAAYAPIGDYGWGAMLQQPTAEAFAPARRMRLRVFQFMAISVLFASLLAYLYSKLIVRPVDKLVEGMDRFSTGDLQHRIPKVADDEIGGLAVSFNNMADRLIEVQEKLKRTEVLVTLRKLASVLSHEIRNPLNSMVINMQILKREFSRERVNRERVEKFFNVLETEIKRVDQLVTDFLMVARPPKVEKSDVAINDMLDEIVVTQVADSLQKGIRIERVYDGVVVASVDPSKLRQAFLNLTLNAIQAMPGGGVLKVGLKVSTQSRRSRTGLKGKVVVISFSDTGHGIRRRDLAKIFDFYFSTKEDGSGLGLAIVQQIVDEHQGRITVKSAVGVGTTVTIYLPV